MKKLLIIFLIIMFTIYYYTIDSNAIPFFNIFSIFNTTANTVDEFTKIVKKSDMGYIILLGSDNQYFQYPSNKIFYIRKSDLFSGYFMLVNHSGALKNISINFFLDYEPITVNFLANNNSDVKITLNNLSPDTLVKINFKIKNIQIGKHELCVVINSISDNFKSKVKDSTYRFTEKNSFEVIQIVRKNKYNLQKNKIRPEKINTIKTNKTLDSNLCCYIKGSKIAVVNNTSNKINCIIFFNKKKYLPIFLESKPYSENIFNTNISNLTKVYCMVSPYTQLEKHTILHNKIDNRKLLGL